MLKRICSILCCMALALTLTVTARAADGKITVFYTNDIHTYINNGGESGDGLTYSKVAALKAATENAVLVDAGDHIQGTAYGGMDEGATIIALMNATGYDAATLGNHEFDYGMDGCMAAIDAAQYPYTSCNFYRESDGVRGDGVLEPFVLVQAGGKTVAFVGITTPESLTSTAPAYFQNEAGDYIYGIAGGADGAELYAAVQTAIDAARAAGADYVIALGHLGVDLSSVPWTSREVIANTTGLDAFIDGHSHTTLPMERVADRDGKPVVLTQTGCYLNAVGRLTIAPDGSITAGLLTAEDLAQLVPDEDVKRIEDAWVAEIDGRLGAVIGYAQVTLDNYDGDGLRLVRRQETNTGDFTADALYYLFDSMGVRVDAAIMNGGGIRNMAVTGALTYRTCKEIHTFGNVACLQTVTGQQIMDALEWGVRELSTEYVVENGEFLQVSGLKFSVDPTITSTVQEDEKGVWAGAPTGEYRVRDVQILDRDTGKYVPLDPDASYNLAGYNYTLRNLGGGFNMFSGAVNVLDNAAEDYMVLANYVQSFPVDPETGLPTIGTDSGYGDVNGSGRITILDESRQTDGAVEDAVTYVVASGDSLWKIARRFYGSGADWTRIYEANRDTVRDPAYILVGQSLTIPA